MSEAPFSAVVVLHDSAPELERLLASIERFLSPSPQLVVVDTGSSDDGPAIARARGAELVELPGNPGFGAANNAGVARARSDACILLNPDVELLDAGLERLASVVRARDCLVAPRLLRPDGRVERSAHPAPGQLEGLVPALLPAPLLPPPVRLRAEPWRSERERPVGWAIAACLAARTETLRRLGPFDPAAFLFYEDMDLCLRAARAGVPTLLFPTVRLHHAGAHATRRAFGGEPYGLLARRRRAVVGRLGRRTLVLDDAAQALTFVTRATARGLLGRDAGRERARLRALGRARRSAGGRGGDREGAGGRSGALEDVHRRERHHHDRLAEALDRAAAPPTPPDEWEAAVLERLGDVAGRRVLELGCGDGGLSLGLLARGAQLTAIDISPAMVATAGARARRFHPDADARFLVAAAESVGLDDERFDAVVGKWVLHHVDLERATAEIARLLRPGGVGVFIDTSAVNPFLAWARRRLPGRLGIARYGTSDERPLGRAELAELERRFGRVEVDFPVFWLAQMLDRHVLKWRWPRASDACRRLDAALATHVPALRPYGYWMRVVVEG